MDGRGPVSLVQQVEPPKNVMQPFASFVPVSEPKEKKPISTEEVSSSQVEYIKGMYAGSRSNGEDLASATEKFIQAGMDAILPPSNQQPKQTSDKKVSAESIHYPLHEILIHIP